MPSASALGLDTPFLFFEIFSLCGLLLLLRLPFPLSVKRCFGGIEL